jgi:hypothetical protein
VTIARNTRPPPPLPPDRLPHASQSALFTSLRAEVEPAYFRVCSSLSEVAGPPRRDHRHDRPHRSDSRRATAQMTDPNSFDVPPPALSSRDGSSPIVLTAHPIMRLPNLFQQRARNGHGKLRENENDRNLLMPRSIRPEPLPSLSTSGRRPVAHDPLDPPPAVSCLARHQQRFADNPPYTDISSISLKSKVSFFCFHQYAMSNGPLSIFFNIPKKGCIPGKNIPPLSIHMGCPGDSDSVFPDSGLSAARIGTPR